MTRYQNTEVKMELASLNDRLAAFAIDYFLIVGYILVIAILLPYLGFDDPSYTSLIYPIFIYSLLFETFRNGQSLGKRWMNIRVVNLDGSTPSFLSFLFRWILRPVDIFFCSGIISIIAILNSKNNQRIGDKVAGTCVVRVVGYDLMEETENTDDSELILEVLTLDEKTIAQLEIALNLFEDENKDISLLAKSLKSKLNVNSDLNDYDFINEVIGDYYDLKSDEGDQ